MDRILFGLIAIHLFVSIRCASLTQLNAVPRNVTNSLPGNSIGWRMLETILDCSSGIEAVAAETCGPDFFLQCVGGSEGIRIPVRCTSNMNFNPASDFCDRFFHCENTPSVCPSSGSLLVTASECNQFFLCLDGASELMQCPEGMNFDPYYGTCSVSYQCGFQCPADAFTAGIGSCQRFFFCGADDPVALECAPGWNYNPTQLDPIGGSCEENYPCQESAVSENIRILTPSQLCPDRGTAFRMHEENCSLYYYCRDGVERLQSCGFDRFDMFTGHCRARNDASCFPGTI